MPTPKVVRRRRAIREAIGLVLAGLLLAFALRVYLTRAARPSPEETALMSGPESEILKAVNLERVRHGRTPLNFSPRLAVAARGHSYDMAIRHYRSHNSLEGSSPADRVRGAGMDCKAVGENIYVDDYQSPLALAGRALKGWLESPEHRDVLLSSDFTETGIGIARSSDGYTYVTQDFAY